MANGYLLDVDVSDVVRLCKSYQSVMSKANYERMWHRVVSNTGRHVRVILSKDIPKHYQVKAMPIRKAVGKPVMQGGGANTGCIIPIKGTRGRIGGMFKARGGAPGWKIPGRYWVSAKIVKGQTSLIPRKAMKGVAPFRNTIAPSLHNLTFTRTSDERFPISAISGIAIPQMPLNRSKEDIEKDIAEFMFKQAEHQIMYYTGMIKK